MRSTHLSQKPHGTAPDGSEVRFLLRTSRGELNHFTLAAHATSSAVAHRTVEEVWYFLSGRGQVWRREGGRERIVDAGPGVSIDIPTGTHFQFRNTGREPLCVIIATMPPWPGDEEAYGVLGPWEASTAR